jgi:uncharacterized OB-fold protein
VRSRTPPVLTEDTAAFWTGGAEGELRISRCRSCGWWLHPPQPVCRWCRSRDIVPEVTSGRGTVWSFTINRYPWSADIRPPYVLAEVEREEQAGLRLLTTIVDCPDVRIGMRVTVRFQRAGHVWSPVFAP